MLSGTSCPQPGSTDRKPRRARIEWFVGFSKLLMMPPNDYHGVLTCIRPSAIRFANRSFLIFNQLYEVPALARSSFSIDRLVAVDWSGVDLRKESQGRSKEKSSIQHHVIKEGT